MPQIKKAQMSVFVRPAKLRYDRKKALPSQPAQTWPPFLKSPSHHRGETLTTFPPQTS